MSNKFARIQKYLKKLDNKQHDTICSLTRMLNVINSRKKHIEENNNQSDKYFNLCVNVYNIINTLLNNIKNNIENPATKPVFDHNNQQLISAFETYKGRLETEKTILKESYGHVGKTKNINLEAEIKKEEKKIVGYKVLIKENKRELANIDNELMVNTENEEKIFSDEIARILNKMEDEHNELYDTLYLEYDKKIDLEDRLTKLQKRYMELSAKYKAAKVRDVKSNKGVKSSLDAKKELQKKYNKENYLLSDQLGNIAKDKNDLTKLMSGSGAVNRGRLERRMQQLNEEAVLVKEQKEELHRRYLEDIDQFESVGGVPYSIRVKREMEQVNNHLKQVKYEINSFSVKYINPIYDAYITRVLSLIGQFNNAKVRRCKVDERNDEKRNETIDKCSKMVTSYGNKIIDCNNRIKEIKEEITAGHKAESDLERDIGCLTDDLENIIIQIDTFMKLRTEINSLS